jgi:hypothetical protein
MTVDPLPEGARDGIDDENEQDPSDPRHESRSQRGDRNLNELLQELRVAGIGVQVLFGFLLSLAFTNRFTVLDADQRRLYAATLLVAALSVALLIAPAAFHRVVFRQQQKEELLHFAQWTSLLGLVGSALAIGGSCALVLMVVLDDDVVPLLVGVLVALYAVLWFVIPLIVRWRGRRGLGEEAAREHAEGQPSENPPHRGSPDV